MRPLTPILCSLLLLADPLVHAAPSSPEITSTPEGDTLSSWRRLSDAVWKRIWRTPDVETPVPVTPETPYRRSSGTLLAKYGGDLVLRFNISTADEAKALSDAANVMFLDVWEFNDDWMDVRLAKDVVPSLLGLLPDSLQTAHTPLMQDLDLVQAICNSYPTSGSTRSHHDDNGAFTPRLRTSSSPSSSDNIFFSDYQPYSVILPWMNLMASMFPTHVRRISIGRTHEGRDIPGLRVGAHPTNDERDDGPRPTILVTGGAHAREWISTSTVNYVAWSLITTYGKSLAVTQMLQAFDWIFVSTLNPDGYVHTWDADRLWRKNRQPTPLRFCRGLDVDRSFPFHWDGESNSNSNNNPCSESYPGTAPLEAHEASSFVRWALNETGTTTTSASRRTEFVAYLDLHSYSEQVLYPYAYSCTAEPPTLEDLEELAFGLAKAMRVTPGGHGYKVGSACEGNVGAKAKPEPKPQPESFRGAGAGAGGGSALDWVYHALRVKYAYQLKLRDTGNYGFLLPKEEIVPTGQEVLEAVVYLGRFLMGEVGLSGGGEGGVGGGLRGEGGEGDQGVKGEHGGEDGGEDGEEEEEGEGEFWDLRRRRRR